MTKEIIVCLFSLALFSACRKSAQTNDAPTAIDTLQTSYAKLFSVTYHEGYKRVAVTNKWSNDTIFYYLTKNTETPTPTDGVKITIPLRDIAVTSCTHIGFLDLLHEIESIKAMASPELAFNETVRQRSGAGAIADIGDAFYLNTEKIMLQNPQAVIMNDFNGENLAAKKLQELGIPVIYINEWQENTPLARAEWIKMIGALLDKEDLADSIFNAVKERYDSIFLWP